MPAPVMAEPAQQKREHQPLKTHRCDIADLPRQPALAPAEAWRPQKQHEVPPHQP
jgi:hypothetical protein